MMHRPSLAALRTLLPANKRLMMASSPQISAAAYISTSSTPQAGNQVFDPVRSPNSLQTYISLSTAANVPLLTFWTASWCPSCRAIAPLLHSLLRDSRVGEDRGTPLNYAPVEFDAPDNAALASEYIITSIPTLLAFDPRRGEPASRLVDARSMADRRFLEDWIRAQASGGGGGGGGAGGGGGGSVFGGLFGGWK
ncbi:Thioredoxin-like protein [Hapsidospora chrysogenum ATCC 11550]|uniref:Thioredoxin-like protein n=1 Tax=Hapsidospora chrysogenum (strain ATCC 11550 / CBS 779.69 / DSM 880 / IAM 14645 / JCM 23072 / IMI 49137) TaxID=857340 RepID=A0A086T2I2_HAPC1|nr:Thioredoxin-like protein [Hapsidospora chrysogenum ATCC 11550]